MKYLVLIAALSIGCGGHTVTCGPDEGTTDGFMCRSRIERTLSISNSFSAEQKEMIKDAGIMWYDATNGKVKLSFIDANTENADIHFSSELDEKYIGMQGFGEILVNPRYYSNNTDLIPSVSLSSLLLHELGHTFGLGHATEPDVIMSPDSDKELHITQLDVEHFNKVMERGIY